MEKLNGSDLRSLLKNNPELLEIVRRAYKADPERTHNNLTQMQSSALAAEFKFDLIAGRL